VFEWGNTPEGTVISVAFEELKEKNAVIADIESLAEMGIVVISDNEEKIFNKTIEYGYGEEKYLDLSRIYQLSRSREDGKVKTSKIPSIQISYGSSIIAAIQIAILQNIQSDELYFTVMQQMRAQIVGGSTYLLHHRKGGQVQTADSL